MSLESAAEFQIRTPGVAGAAAGPLPTEEGGASSLVVGSSRIVALAPSERAEVSTFLSARPLHNVAMVGLVIDNGLDSVLNRGRFYACRDASGRLEGVALVGHTVLFDARTDEAVEGFALVARDCARKYLVMGETERVERFWHFYAAGGDDGAPRFTRRVLLMGRRETPDGCEPVRGLRPATLKDLEFVMSIQAEMAAEESGTNPLEFDRLGFHVRCARRVESGRAWVYISEGRPVFKADVLSETPEAAYLEGIYVSPEERGKGTGRRCLAQMCRALLRGTKSVCLFVDERNERARRFYGATGFEPLSLYTILYF